MPRTCTICRHSRRRAIDRAIVAGQSSRSIARKFRLGRSAVGRHKLHVSRTVKKAAERREENLGENLIAEMRNLLGEARGLLNAMKRKRDYRGAVAGVRATTEVLGEMDKMLARATALGTVAGQHPSPCPHCNPEEYQSAVMEAVGRALGKGPLIPIKRPHDRPASTRESDIIDVDVLPQPAGALPAHRPGDELYGELAILPQE